MRGLLSFLVACRGRREISLSLCTIPARAFRSDAALQALQRASDDGDFSVVLYDYPSFSAALSGLFLLRYHSLRRLPAVILPFSSFEPLRYISNAFNLFARMPDRKFLFFDGRVDDLKLQGLKTCYLLGFIGPGRFALDLSKFIPEVFAFDHRKVTAEKISKLGSCPENLQLQVNTSQSSARAVYEYFSKKLKLTGSGSREAEGVVRLLTEQEEQRAESLLEYTEDEDLGRRKLEGINAFKFGLKEALPNLNCLTNPCLFDQLLKMDSEELISWGENYLSSRQAAAKKLLGGEFKIRLGRGFYGECLCIRADGHSHLSHEIGDELSRRSAAVGLRPMGAVAFMQRGNLKMCLRSPGGAANTCEIAKAYGGGGRPASSSFVIRMDEYGQWALPG